jgi:hypothetical protein
MTHNKENKMESLKFSVDDEVVTPTGIGRIAWFSPVLRKYAVVEEKAFKNYTEDELSFITPKRSGLIFGNHVCPKCSEPTDTFYEWKLEEICPTCLLREVNKMNIEPFMTTKLLYGGGI